MKFTQLTAVPLLVCVSLLTASWASADPGTGAMDPDSTAGKAIVARALTDVAKKLGKPAKLGVEDLNASQGWAFVWAKMTESDGTLIDYTGTPFAADAAHGLKSKSYAGLLRSDHGSWSVVESAVGPTSPIWLTWGDKYSVPASIFDTTGS